MQMIRYGRSTLPMPQVFHTAEHQASELSNVNTLSRGHCGLRGMGAGRQPRSFATRNTGILINQAVAPAGYTAAQTGPFAVDTVDATTQVSVGDIIFFNAALQAAVPANAEVMRVTAVEANSITVAGRGYDGTTAAAIADNDILHVADDHGTSEVENCNHVGAQNTNGVTTTFNEDLPFSRNAYIEQGMDVFSSLPYSTPSSRGPSPSG